MSTSPLSPARWSRVLDLFHAALEKPEAERDAFLHDACSGDEALYHQVQNLLAADDGDATLLRTGGGLDLAADRASMIGEVVGPYRIEAELGRGGMGVVYRARREDVGTDVALKVLRDRFPSAGHVRRFLRERRVAGRLDHPNVARFLDAGVTGDGTPFFVMEYVEGRPITEAVHGLDLNARLQLFLHVCTAVQYAHQNLVVHRDLKPSNVFVTDDGTVKLLDFGIAKLLEEDDALTQSSEQLLTPAYAAPEQVSDAPVSTATDVYALGALLYEMLTGTRPLDVDGVPLSEVVRRIQHQTPQRASEQARGPGGVAPGRLRGDLDAICAKALAKDPGERYASAEGMKTDVQNVLDHRPVSAMTGRWTTQARKFARRHGTRLSVAAVVAVVFAVVIGLYTTRLQDERDRAEQQAETAHDVVAFMVQTLEEGDPNAAGGDTLTIYDVIDRAETRADELDDKPLVKANVLDAIGRVRLLHGDITKADSLLRAGLALRETTLSPTHPDVAASLNHLAEVQIMLGKFAEADSSMQRGISILKDAHGTSSPELVTPTKVLAQVRYRQGRYASADSLYERVIAIHERTPVLSEDSYADTYQEWGMTASRQDNLDAAVHRYQTAIDLFRPRYPDGNIAIASALANLASIQRQQGDYEAALDGYTASLDMTRSIVGDRHLNVALIQGNVAVAHQKMGNLETAEDVMRENLQLRTDLLGPEHPYTGTAHHVLAKILVERGKEADAETQFREALAIRQAATPEHWRTASTRLELGRLLATQARYAEAEPLLIDGLTGLIRTRGADHESADRGRRFLTDLYAAWDAPERKDAVRDSLADAGIALDAPDEVKERW